MKDGAKEAPPPKSARPPGSFPKALKVFLVVTISGLVLLASIGMYHGCVYYNASMDIYRTCSDLGSMKTKDQALEQAEKQGILVVDQGVFLNMRMFTEEKYPWSCTLTYKEDGAITGYRMHPKSLLVYMIMYGGYMP